MHGRDDVTVSMTWRQNLQVANETYSISVSPMIDGSNIRFTENTSVQLILAYNTLYNVSLTASLCELNSSTTVTGLKYGKSKYTVLSLTLPVSLQGTRGVCAL